MGTSEEFRFIGKGFDHRALTSHYRALYDMPMSRLENALATAIDPSTGSNLAAQFSYTIRKELNALAWDTAVAGCAIGIYNSVPVLIQLACREYAAGCDPLTALPFNNNSALTALDTKRIIRNKLDRPIHTEADLAGLLGESDNTTPLARVLTELALKFIAMHEAMHVILGHTRFLKKKFGINELWAYSPEQANLIDDNELLRTLEFIADRYAVRGLFVRLQEGDYDSDELDILVENSLLERPVYLSRCLVTACCLLFHLFPGAEASIRSDGPYPHPYIRARWLCNELTHELDPYHIGFYEPINTMTWVAAQLASNYAGFTSWEKANSEDFDEHLQVSNADETYVQMTERAGHWQTFLLKKYGPQYPEY